METIIILLSAIILFIPAVMAYFLGMKYISVIAEMKEDKFPLYVKAIFAISFHSMYFLATSMVITYVRQ